MTEISIATAKRIVELDERVDKIRKTLQWLRESCDGAADPLSFGFDGIGRNLWNSIMSACGMDSGGIRSMLTACIEKRLETELEKATNELKELRTV